MFVPKWMEAFIESGRQLAVFSASPSQFDCCWWRIEFKSSNQHPNRDTNTQIWIKFMCSLKSQRFFSFASVAVLQAVVAINFFFSLGSASYFIFHILNHLHHYGNEQNVFTCAQESIRTINPNTFILDFSSSASLSIHWQVVFFLFSTNSSRCLHACSCWNISCCLFTWNTPNQMVTKSRAYTIFKEWLWNLTYFGHGSYQNNSIYS